MDGSGIPAVRVPSSLKTSATMVPLLLRVAAEPTMIPLVAVKVTSAENSSTMGPVVPSKWMLSTIELLSTNAIRPVRLKSLSTVTTLSETGIPAGVQWEESFRGPLPTHAYVTDV